MKWCYSSLGDGARPVDDDYIPAEGEAIIDRFPATEAELRNMFPDRGPTKDAEEKARKALAARAERDRQLRDVYDSGTQMIRRELEMGSQDHESEAKLISKRTELHVYARLLQAIPDQSGFPEDINWPVIPSGNIE